MTGSGGPVLRAAAQQHSCLAFDDPAGFEAAARIFLDAGAAAGLQTMFLGREQPAGFGHEVVDVASQYPVGAVIDPEAGLARYAAATERALAGGWSGLRVAADVTALVRTPAQFDAFARYESLVDRYMRSHPFSAICAVDRTATDPDVVRQLSCRHPGSDAPFRLFADGPDRSGTGLAGELDASTLAWFEHALDHADLRPADGELTVDGTDLVFLDHRSLQRLDDCARRHDATAVLRTPFTAAARMAELLGLTRLRVEITR